MPAVDMSPQAIAARLKLASELRDLCLLLGTARIESKPEAQRKQVPKKLRDFKKSSK